MQCFPSCSHVVCLEELESHPKGHRHFPFEDDCFQTTDALTIEHSLKCSQNEGEQMARTCDSHVALKIEIPMARLD